MNFLKVFEDNPMHALLLQQPRLVRLLEKRARDLGVDIRWGRERLAGLAPTPDGVTVAVASPERNYDLDATYLVGADGGRSPVRKAVGIDFPWQHLGHGRPGSRTCAFPTSWRPTTADYLIPGFGPLPFGHAGLDNGGLIVARFSSPTD